MCINQFHTETMCINQFHTETMCINQFHTETMYTTQLQSLNKKSSGVCNKFRTIIKVSIYLNYTSKK